MNKYEYGLSAYVIAVCADMNPRLQLAYNTIVLLNSSNLEDRERVKKNFTPYDILETIEDVEVYYKLKLLQIKNYTKNLKDADKFMAFTDSDKCRIVFKDCIIKDDDTAFNIIKLKRKTIKGLKDINNE